MLLCELRDDCRDEKARKSQERFAYTTTACLDSTLSDYSCSWDREPYFAPQKAADLALQLRAQVLQRALRVGVALALPSILEMRAHARSKRMRERVATSKALHTHHLLLELDPLGKVSLQDAAAPGCGIPIERDAQERNRDLHGCLGNAARTNVACNEHEYDMREHVLAHWSWKKIVPLAEEMVLQEHP
ncbi:hypothetical protein FI667_g16448, partial [Globisporangium splendens]